MASIRQNKIATLVQQELAEIFRSESRTLCQGAMVTVTIVRMTKDMGIARCYLSVFGVKDKDVLIANIRSHTSMIRHILAQRIKTQVRKIPLPEFYLDDSLDYAENIDQILKDS